MRLDKKSLILYAITDRAWLGEISLEEQVEEALKGGATFVQIREKELSYNEFLNIAKKVKKLTDKYNVPLVINDNVEVAIESNADGIHIGQEDMDAGEARKLIGTDKILGVSAYTVKDAKIAEENGADYIGAGAVFKTSSKDEADVISIDLVKEICNSVSIPVVAIGGINETNILSLKGSGIAGVCVISAIFSKENIYDAAKNLYRLAKEII